MVNLFLEDQMYQEFSLLASTNPMINSYNLSEVLSSTLQVK